MGIIRIINSTNKKKSFFYILIFSILINSNTFFLTKSVYSADKKILTSSKTKEKYKHITEDVYLVGAGDLLYLNIIGFKDFSTELYILNDGTIQLPFVGPIKISGLSLNRAKSLITKSLAKEVLNPNIELTLIKQRPIKVSIVGEVNKPGIYTLTSSKDINNNGLENFMSSPPTVIDAIQLAGGITTFSNLKEIKLKRKFLEGDNIQYKQTTLNLYEMLISGEQKQNPYLFDGDIIKIKKVESINKSSIIAAKSNFAPSEINVYVIGEVRNPGLLKIQNGTTLNQAILSAGAPLGWRSKKNNVELIRMNKNGSLIVQKMKFNLNQDSQKDINQQLKDGDIIRLKTTSPAIVSDLIVNAAKPLQGLITALSFYKLVE